MAHTLEHRFVIWNDANGECIEVGDDRDGLGLTEVRFVGDDNKILSSVTFTDEELPMVIQALQKRLERVESISSEDELPLLVEAVRTRMDRSKEPA